MSSAVYNASMNTLVTGERAPLQCDSAGNLKIVGPSGTTANQVQGNVASAATDSGNPVKVGGVYMTTPTTLTNGQRGNMQLNAEGAVRIAGSTVALTRAISTTVATIADQNGASRPLAAASMLHNGTTLDPAFKPNTFKRVASSAASGSPDFAKASAGDVMQFWGLCGATAAYLQLYNKATAPTIGTDTPVLTYPILATSKFAESIPNGGAYFPTGIAFAFTTDAAGTTGSAAAAITSFALLVA